MTFTETSALHKILRMKNRLKIIQGGSSAGKTIAILLILIDRAQREKGKTFSVVSETMPHLKRGAIKDFLAIMEGHGYYKDSNWNRSDFFYLFETGSRIEFFSADSSDKVRGPRRDVLFINECNNVSHETYTQLAIRTKEDIYLDYNPVSEFWVHSEIIPNNEHDFLILTYKDNEALPKTIVDEIESRKENKYFWQVYGLGQIGEVEGKIYKDWQIIENIPHEARLVRRGIDFGFKPDPAVVVDIYAYNGGFILDEVVYQTELTNKQLADIILQKEKILAIADSSEPKSIDEISGYGVLITGAAKGPGSVINGIKHLQSLRISVTSRSLNVIKEYRNYLWLTDRNGKIIPDTPDHDYSHAMDAIRYGLEGYHETRPILEPIRSKPKPYFRRNFR